MISLYNTCPYCGTNVKGDLQKGSVEGLLLSNTTGRLYRDTTEYVKNGENGGFTVVCETCGLAQQPNAIEHIKQKVENAKPTEARLGRSIGIAFLIAFVIVVMLMLVIRGDDYGTAGPVGTFLFMWIFFSFIAFIFVFMYEKQTTEANKIEHILRRIPDFNLSQFFVSQDRKVGIAVDESVKRICIWANNASRIFYPRDILELEIIEDGHSVNKISRGSQAGGAIIGGVLLGGAGAVIGGLSGKSKSATKVTTLYLKVIVNDTKNPVLIFKFMDVPTGILKDSLVYKDALQRIYHWHGLLSVLIKQADKEINAKQAKDASLSDVNVSVADELQKLATLLEKGVITQVEFDHQKAKILSL